MISIFTKREEKKRTVAVLLRRIRSRMLQSHLAVVPQTPVAPPPTRRGRSKTPTTKWQRESRIWISMSGLVSVIIALVSMFMLNYKQVHTASTPSNPKIPHLEPNPSVSPMCPSHLTMVQKTRAHTARLQFIYNQLQINRGGTKSATLERKSVIFLQ